MNRKHRITTALIALVVALSFAALATPVAAQSVDSISTTLSDTDGDGVDDQVQVDVTVSNVQSGQVTIELGESNFDAAVTSNSASLSAPQSGVSFTTPMDPDGDGDNEAVEFVSIGAATGTYTVTADLSNQAGGDTGSVDVTLGGGTTDSATYSVSGAGPGPGPGTGTLTVVTGSQGDTIEAIQGGTVVASGTTGSNGQVVLTVPANTPTGIDLDPTDGVVEQPGVQVAAGATRRVIVGARRSGFKPADLTQQFANARGLNPSGNPRVINGGDTLFLGEDDIAIDKGVFAGPVTPGQFVSPDDDVLTITNGIVDPSNAVTTYTGPNGNTIDVREARVQRLDVIDVLSNQRLGETETREIEQSTGTNVQFAVDYNYFQSTSIDEELTQGGNDVTSIYQTGELDGTNRPFASADSEGRSYDALFNFSIDDTGEYTFVAEPLTGDDRPQGRDVGFADREAARDTTTVTIIDDEDIAVELGSDSANQGDRVDFEIAPGSLREGQVATVTIDEDDFRYTDFGTFGGLVNSQFNIAGDAPTKFVSSVFRRVDELENSGLIFRATQANALSAAGFNLGTSVQGRQIIVFDTSTLARTDVYVVGQNGALSQVGTVDLTAPQAGNLDEFRAAVSGTQQLSRTIELQRAYGIIQRDDGEAVGQIDTEKLDDTSVDIEAFGNANGEGIEPPTDPEKKELVKSALGGVFSGSKTLRDEDDEASLEVQELELTVDSPGDTYVPGTEVDLTGSITGAAEDVIVLARNRDNYFHVATVSTSRSEGSYEEQDFELSTEARTEQAQDILAQPGVYRYGVIDSVDTDIIKAYREGLGGNVDLLDEGNTAQGGESGIDESDFNQGASTQVSLRVVAPSLEASFRTFDGGVFKDDGLDLRGTLVGPRDYLVFLTDDRGNSILEEFTADEEDGQIEEDDISFSGTGPGGEPIELTDGTITASVLSPGRDRTFGDGTFDIPAAEVPGSQERFTESSINNFIEFADALTSTTRTDQQVRDILLSETVEEAGSDDLIVTEQFRLSDDSRTSITDIVPDSLRNNLTGIHPIEVGETMVVRGITNRNPDDAAITVEAEQGPSPAQLGTAVADDWPADGEEGADRPGGVWAAELKVTEEVEPGEYIIRSDDGERIDEATVEIVAQGTLEEGARLQDEAEQLRQQVQELRGQIQSLQQQRNQLEQNVSDLQQTNEELRNQIQSQKQRINQLQQQNRTQNNGTDTGQQEGQGQPGFTAVAALVALIAVALLALRRREEDE